MRQKCSDFPPAPSAASTRTGMRIPAYVPRSIVRNPSAESGEALSCISSAEGRRSACDAKSATAPAAIEAATSAGASGNGGSTRITDAHPTAPASGKAAIAARTIWGGVKKKIKLGASVRDPDIIALSFVPGHSISAVGTAWETSKTSKKSLAGLAGLRSCAHFRNRVGFRSAEKKDRATARA